EQTRLTRAGLANNVHMTAAVGTIQPKLLVNTTEVGQAKGADIFVVVGVVGDNWQLGWRLGRLGGGPYNAGRFDIGVRQVEDRGQLFDVEYVAFVDKKTGAVLSEHIFAKAWGQHAKTVQVGAVVLFKGAHNGLHARASGGFAVAKIHHAN